MDSVFRASLLAGVLVLFGCKALGVEGASHQGQAGIGSIERTSEVYKTAGAAQLTLEIFTDPKAKADKPRPAIVFFFGGGWNAGTPKQFEAQARYFASRGMVAMTADYRVRSRHRSRVIDSVADARSAIRWVRANAKKLGVDPNRIAAAGGSAGGHLAASAAFISEFDEPSEDKGISASPNALVLFNPALVLAELPGYQFGSLRGMPDRGFLGAEPSRVSPAHWIKPGGPPTIIFHGEADKTVPYQTAQAFTERMKAAGNRCTLVGYPGQGHGFFNSSPWMTRTLVAADEFLGSLGWIAGKPTLPSRT